MLKFLTDLSRWTAWIESCLAPVASINRAMSEARGGKKLEVFELWLPPIILTIIMDLFIFFIYGINGQSNWLLIGGLAMIVLFRLFIVPLVIFSLLMMLGQSPNLKLVFLAYTFAVIYQPIIEFATIGTQGALLNC